MEKSVFNKTNLKFAMTGAIAGPLGTAIVSRVWPNLSGLLYLFALIVLGALVGLAVHFMSKFFAEKA